MSLSAAGFVDSNWQNIIITLAGGALFFIISYYYTEKVLNSAQKERVKQAKNALLDILESKVINKQDISSETIINLTDAINREYNVNLSKITTPILILQDLNLVFEKSHHLESSQKAIFCSKIQGYIEDIKKINEESGGKLEISKDYAELIGKLSENIDLNDSVNAKKILDSLKTKISKDNIYDKSYESTTLGKLGKEAIQICIGILGAVIASIVLNIIQQYLYI